MKQFCQLFTMLLLLTACGGGGGKSSDALQGDTLVFRYATHLELVHYPRFSVVKLLNPWNNRQLLHTYVLVPKEEQLPANLPQGTVVRVPLDNLLVTSSVHCNLLKEFGKLSTIGGVCDLKYIHIDEIAEGCANGTIVNAGEGMNPDMERILDFNPEALFMLPFENCGYGQIEKLNKPLIECADYMETSPLGQAEWMRFYGRLMGCENLADSLFAVVEENYLQLKESVAHLEDKPTLLCETKTSSAWYVPAGNSTMGQLYCDAGANYLFAGYAESGSVPLAFEAVFEKAHDAEFWLMKYNSSTEKSYRTLQQENTSYSKFKAFREHRIYDCNLDKVPFYEETPFRPDWLLQELIAIFHPSLQSNYTLRYYAPLNE